MATKEEKEKLIEVLKFTPRTYKVRLWGYGGEYVMGSFDRKIYDYFKQRRLDVSEFAWNEEYTEENNIPEEMQPFYPGSWHDCDNMGHCWGVDRTAGTLQVEDENGDVIYEQSLDDVTGMGIDGEPPEPEWSCGDEYWIDSAEPGTAVFMAVSSEKGTFFEAELPLTAPFNAGKFTLNYDDFDCNEIVTGVSYDGEELDNWGGDTSGKGIDFGFYIAGSNKQDGKGYEKYRTMDDIEYGLTEWFPKKINPVREGMYNVKTAGKNSYTYQANWNGTDWRNTWNREEALKIKEWQGIAYDPDEHFLRDELDNILTLAEKVELVKELEHEVRDEQATGAKWPFSTGADTTLNTTEEEVPTEESKSKWWTVKTYHKKNCEQIEYFIQRDGTGRIKVTDGFRWCTYSVETNDGEFPKFDFDYVPGGDGNKDSLNMNSLSGDNIESSELVDMFDGGCWGDTEIEGIEDEAEVERLQEFISENGSYAIEDDGEWYLDETEVWVWGPIEVTDDEGNTRIVIADADGNVTDYKE